MRYFEMSQLPIIGDCPHYEKCWTAQTAPLPKEFCARYRCNTFYQFDTIQWLLDSPWGPEAIAKCTSDKSTLSRIVEQHLHGELNGNGNGHKKTERRINTIAVHPDYA